VRGGFILGREKCRIGGHQARRAAEHLLMNAHGGEQQVAIVGALIVDFVIDNDLCLGFLNLTILPNSVGLAALPLRIISVCGSNRLTSLPST